MKKIFLAGALAGAMISPIANANWFEVQRHENGGYYTGVGALNDDTYAFGVYFYPDSSCTPVLGVVDMYPNLDKERRKTFISNDGSEFPGRFQSKVDGVKNADTESTIHIAYDVDHDRGDFMHMLIATEDYLDDLRSGDRLKVRVKLEEGDWDVIPTFSLDGSSYRIDQAQNRCLAAMGDGELTDEWSDHWDDDYQTVDDVW